MTHAHLKLIIMGSALFISTHQPLLTRDFLGFPESIFRDACKFICFVTGNTPTPSSFLCECFSSHTFRAFPVQWKTSDSHIN